MEDVAEGSFGGEVEEGRDFPGEPADDVDGGDEDDAGGEGWVLIFSSDKKGESKSKFHNSTNPKPIIVTFFPSVSESFLTSLLPLLTEKIIPA